MPETLIPAGSTVGALQIRPLLDPLDNRILLGHALGLQHTDDPHALMHPVMKDQDIAHFRLTQADRDLLLAR